MMLKTLKYYKAVLEATDEEEKTIKYGYNRSIEGAQKFFEQKNPGRTVLVMEDDFIRRDIEQNQRIQNQRDYIQRVQSDLNFMEQQLQTLNLYLNTQLYSESEDVDSCYRVTFLEKNLRTEEIVEKAEVFLAPSEKDAAVLIRRKHGADPIQVTELEVSEEIQKCEEAIARINENLEKAKKKLPHLKYVKSCCEYTWHKEIIKEREKQQDDDEKVLAM